MNKNKLLHGSIGFVASLLAPAAYAEIPIPVDGLNVNVLGVVVGVTPDYYGSSHEEGAVGLYGRYQFEDSQRYVLLMGPQLSANLLNDSNWRLGPMIRYRSARDHDVDDKVVRQMDKVDSAIQGGAFVGYKLQLSDVPLHQVNFNANITSGKTGTEAHMSALYWKPFSKTMVGTIGLGMTYGNGKFMENYFGVTSEHDISLYPSLGGQPYKTSSGVVGWNIPVGLTTFLSPEWLLSVGGRYERLVSDAKNSPVVDQRGDANQWIGGVGLAYVFK